MKWFYKVWVDAILFEKAKPNNENSWKGFVLAGMSFILALNIITIYTFLFISGIDIMEPVDIWLSEYFKEEMIRNFIWAMIMMFAPALLINYFAIFYKSKYEYLIEKYGDKEDRRGKLFWRYFVVSFALFLCIGLYNNYCR